MSKEIKEAIKLLENIIRITNTQPFTISDEIINKQASQALAKLRAEPEPTSLGNTLRSIADNSTKSETDKNIIYQAAHRLDRWWAYIQELKTKESCGTCGGYSSED